MNRSLATAALLHWHRGQYQTQKAALEGILEIPPTLEEARRLASVNAAFAEVEPALAYFSLSETKERRGIDELVEAATEVHTLLGERAEELHTYATEQRRIYETLTTAPFSPRAFSEKHQAFAHAIEVLRAYDPGEASKLEPILTNVRSRVVENSRANQQVAEEVAAAPRAEEELRQDAQEIHAKLWSRDYRPHTKGARRKLRELKEELQDIAEVANEHNYSWKDGVNEDVVLAENNYEISRNAYQKHFFLKAGVTLTALAGVAFFTLSMARIVMTHKTINEGYSRPTKEQTLTERDLDTLRTGKEALEEQVTAQAARIARLEKRTTDYNTEKRRVTTPASVTVPVHIVRRGESLSSIREALYHDKNWDDLYEANNGSITDERRWVYPGQILHLPTAGLQGEHQDVRLTPEGVSYLEEHERVPIPAYRVPRDGVTIGEVASLFNTSSATLLNAYDGINRALGRLQKNDYISLPPTVTTGKEYLLVRGAS